MLTDRSRIARSLCSALAIATATLLSAEAHAQAAAPSGSFQGNGTFNSGSGSITAGPNTTTINVTSPNAVIDWSTFDTATGGGAINFQPSSTTATFQSLSNFSVLNRILPTDPSRAVQFNGNVIAQIQGTTTTPGGDVFFYSPGGIILGSTAVFNVGNLGLTSAAPQVVGGVFIQKNPATGLDFVNFTTANPGTGVDIQAGAQITGTGGNQGNYLAIVAPRISNAGAISGKRVSALVSADAATMTLNVNGLFDIQVTSGTSATGTTLFNSGSITGPAGTPGFANRIYMVAVPKNTAITMAIAAGSTLGFNIAAAADVNGNAIVLSAGRDIVNGNIANGPSAGGGTGAANLAIEGTLTSALLGTATGTAFLFARAGNITNAASIVDLRGLQATLSADGAGASIAVSGNVSLSSNVFGGSGGANATGGTSEIFATNGGGVSLGAAANLNAGGVGGIGIPNVANGGIGTGGIAVIQAQTGGTVNIAGAASVNANGNGGAAFSGGGNGGSGIGGRSQVFASGAGSKVTFSGGLTVSAFGVGGVGVNGLAGAGTGGQAFVNAQTTAGASIDVGGDATLTAGARGGAATGGSGGAGVGGNAVAFSGDGNTVKFRNALTIFADGIGGAASGGDAGSATGGTARIAVGDGSLTVGGLANLNANARGGIGSLASNGGAATGGLALVETLNVVNPTTNRSIALSDLQLNSNAFGGAASGTGNGGDAGAGRSRVFANGGTISVGGNASLNAQAFAGNGINGGNAISARPDGEQRVLIGSVSGTISVAGSTSLLLSVRGGNGDLGGSGGTAFAGDAAIDARSNNGPSAILLQSLQISTSANGGTGGAGGAGQAGGRGGDAYGGFSSAHGNAGRGVLTVAGATTVTANAIGGTGGVGGTGGSTAAGAAGGGGGRAFAGGFSLGTRSGVDTVSNTGSATFANVTGSATGFGGSGGSGGSGTTQGGGGNGGAGFGGSAGILVRGAPTKFGDVTYNANGLGGNGGAGATVGNGGDGYAGDGALVVTQRFQRTERGTLTANNVSYIASGTGGSGSIAGKSYFPAAISGTTPGAEGDFLIRQSDVTLNNLSFQYSGALAPNLTTTILQPDATTGIAAPTSVTVMGEPFDINLTASTANIAGTLSVITPGEMRVSLDASTLNAGNLTLDANNFVLPATRPATLGTFNVSGNLSLNSQRDFLAYANFNFTGNRAFNASGSVLTGDLSTSGSLDLIASGSITLGNVQATNVSLNAGAALATGAIVTGGDIDLVAGGSATTGQLTAGNGVAVQAVGAINIAGASAGIVNPVPVTGADYTVALRSLASITAGALTARANVGLSSPGSITVGNISADQIVLALAGTGLTTGSITTLSSGRVYLANFSMEALGGQITQDFNPALVFAASPRSIAGPIVVGAVSTGTFQAATTQAFSSGNIATAALTNVIADGSLSTGALTAGQTVSLQSGAALSTGAVQAGDAVGIAATGGVSTGNVSAGIVNPSTNPAATYKIAIASQTGAISTGTLTARRDVGLQAAQGIATGDIAGRDVLLLAGSAVTTGAILAGSQTQPTGRVYIGNFSMARSGANVFSPFTALTLFNIDPVRTGGAITIGGAVTAGSLYASTAQGITLQAVTAGTSTSPGFIDIDAGGLATINGRLAAARKIDIASRDIDITATGSLDGLIALSEIQLASNNPNGAFIGDGLTTTSGYMLSNAEYARLKAGQIAVVGDNQTELVTDMTIGNLSIAGSQLYGTGGTALFATGNRATKTPSGLLRINGAVSASGFTATNEVDLLSGTVELEAEKGSLKIDNGSGGLGGQIVVEADHFHVASDAILAKLRVDPLYEGHIKELNAPALVQRTDGVLNALNVDFSSKSQTVYIQNTGSVAVPAGIVTRLDSNPSTSSNNTNTSNEGSRPPGGSEFVINGQIQTNTGIVTGKAAFDLVIASLKAEAVADGKTFASDLTPTSTFNSCVIATGVCAFGNADPVAALSSEIRTVTNATLDESPVAPAADDSDEGDDSSGDQDDKDSKSDEGSSPIAPPAPLISTRALDGNVNVVEPVSGAGNPALFGSAVDETNAQGEKP